MPIGINGTGSITGLSAGGLPDGSVMQPGLAGGVAGNGHVFDAYASASQTVTIATNTKINIDTVVFDTNNCFDVTNKRFTPNVAGYYSLNGVLRATAATTFSTINVTLYKNGSAYVTGSQTAGSMTAGVNNHAFVSSVIYLNGSTDYVELWGYVNGTGTASFNFNSSSNTSRFSGALVRAV